MGMSPGQVKRWAKTRRMGRTQFVWLFGVLGFGLTMGFCLPVASVAVGSYLHVPFMPGWERLPNLIALCLIISLIGGYFCGLCIWWRAESQYDRATRDEWEPIS